MLRFAAALFVSVAMAAQPSLTARQQGEDFDAAWRAIDEGYAYFDKDHAAWQRARDAWRPRAVRAKTRDDFIASLEGALDALHDDHVSLSERRAGSPRRVPSETDIWARWRDGAAQVEAVRAFGDADVAGVRPGHRVTRIGEMPVSKAVSGLLGSERAASGEARDWALRHALAGPSKGVMRLEAADGDAARTFEIERSNAPRASGPPIIARRIGERRDLGYIRLRGGLADPGLVRHFSSALHYMKDTRALILDLRDLAGAGSRETTQSILARFVTAPAKWQLRDQGRERVADVVKPNGMPPYRAPVVVLVDRWTAGEGEALAAGLVAVARARLVGTPMAGLRGELREATLPHSGIVLRFPGERTYHVDGTPREKLRPHVEVDLAKPSGGPGDPILYQALKLFEG